MMKNMNYLLDFIKKNNNAFNLGLPFLNNWATVYDYEKEEITFYGDNIEDMTYDWYKDKALTFIGFVIIFDLIAFVCIAFCFVF